MDASLIRETHKTIKAVSEGVEGFRFNSAIAKLYAFLATIRQHDKAGAEAKKTALSTLARLVAPFTPHLAEEAWARLGEEGMILDAPWPVYDPVLAADDEVTLPIQVNGKRRGEIRVARGLEPAEVEAIVIENQVDDLQGMRLANIDLVLVAMDSIITRLLLTSRSRFATRAPNLALRPIRASRIPRSYGRACATAACA